MQKKCNEYARICIFSMFCIYISIYIRDTDTDIVLQAVNFECRPGAAATRYSNIKSERSVATRPGTRQCGLSQTAAGCHESPAARVTVTVTGSHSNGHPGRPSHGDGDCPRAGWRATSSRGGRRRARGPLLRQQSPVAGSVRLGLGPESVPPAAAAAAADAPAAGGRPVTGRAADSEHRLSQSTSERRNRDRLAGPRLTGRLGPLGEGPARGRPWAPSQPATGSDSEAPTWPPGPSHWRQTAA
jgi:hypothetical protein